MIRYWLALVLIFPFGVFGWGEDIEIKMAVRDATVEALTVYGAEFSVAFKKDNKEGLIYLSPCEDNIELVIDGNLQNQYQIILNIEVLSVDLENLKFFRRITFRVLNKTAADKLIESFIKPFRKIESCSAV